MDLFVGYWVSVFVVHTNCWMDELDNFMWIQFCPNSTLFLIFAFVAFELESISMSLYNSYLWIGFVYEYNVLRVMLDLFRLFNHHQSAVFLTSDFLHLLVMQMQLSCLSHLSISERVSTTPN